MNDFRQIKNLVNRLEKKEKELASYKAKTIKLEQEISEIKEKLNSLLNSNSNQNIYS